MDKETVLFCADKVAGLAKAAGYFAANAVAPTVKLNALVRQEILLEVEMVLRKSANGTGYCGTCGQWTNGPLTCCANDGDLPEVSEVEAFAVRASRVPNAIAQGREHSERPAGAEG